MYIDKTILRSLSPNARCELSLAVVRAALAKGPHTTGAHMLALKPART